MRITVLISYLLSYLQRYWLGVLPINMSNETPSWYFTNIFRIRKKTNPGATTWLETDEDKAIAYTALAQRRAVRT